MMLLRTTNCSLLVLLALHLLARCRTQALQEGRHEAQMLCSWKLRASHVAAIVTRRASSSRALCVHPQPNFHALLLLWWLVF
jgi:hypothetical protein